MFDGEQRGGDHLCLGGHESIADKGYKGIEP